MVKQKKAAAPPKPIIIEDDADQDISDDGEVPVYDPNADSDSDEAMDDASGEEDGSDSGNDDEDAMSEDDVSSAPVAGPSTSTKPDGPASAFRAPTTEELANIKAASELFKSNVFKLKIEALLPQIRAKPSSYKSTLEPLLLALHSHILALPSIAPLSPLSASKRLAKQGVKPLENILPRPTKETNWKVAFEPPRAGGGIQVVGSWANGMSMSAGKKGKSGVTVDLAVEMPAELFQEKDYLDARFFHKKSYYLGVLASSLSSTDDLGVKVEYDTPGNNERRAALLVTPLETSRFASKKHPYSVRIILVLPSDSSIPLSRLSPAHSNLRPTAPTPSTTEAPTSIPTPHYNNDLLLHTTPISHLILIHSLLSDVPSARDAVALLRLWARQRGYQSDPSGQERTVAGFESVGGIWWTLLVAYCVWGDEEGMIQAGGKGGARGKGRRTVGKGLSSYQLFRAVLDLLASRDFVSEPVRVRLPSGPTAVVHDLSGREHPTFVSPLTPYNFLMDVPESSLKLLRHEAQRTLLALDRPAVSDGFEALFMHDQRGVHSRFDSVLRLNISTEKLSASENIDFSNPRSSILARIESVIARALGERVRAFALLASPSSASTSASPSTLILGLILDPSHAFKLVEHGPPASDVEGSEAFRAFWGPKAELRRFADGRILESVVWNGADRTKVPAQIVEYVLERHVGLKKENGDVMVWDDGWDGLVDLPKTLVQRYASTSETSPEAAQRLALTAFEELVKSVKAMENLPLSLVNAVPASPGLTYTSVFPPLPLSPKSLPSLPDAMKYIPTMEIILQFERSTRWPDDLGAIQKVKIALLEAVAQGLLASKAASYAIVAFDRDADTRPLEDHVSLEVMLSSGFAFRARVQHDRERTLMERLIVDKRSTSEHERKRAQAALERHTTRFIDIPAHYAAVLSLQRTFVSYAHSVRLFKRWIAAHWLGAYVSEQVCELLVGEVYLNPGVRGVPASGQAGFVRALEVLAHWEFREDPLVVPLYSVSRDVDDEGLPVGATASSLSMEQMQKTRDAFAAHLATNPGLSSGAWTIATEKDASGRVWTHGITALVASRVRELAAASLGLLNHGTTASGAGLVIVKSIFAHPTEDYDFIIDLRPQVITRYAQNLSPDASVWGESAKTKYVNLAAANAEVPSLFGSTIRLDFDPIRMFFEELQRIYGDSIVWFYDPLGGTKIGGVWNPSLASVRPFRLLLGFSSQPANGSTSNTKKMDVTLNKGAILAEIERLGVGLISKINVRSS